MPDRGICLTQSDFGNLNRSWITPELALGAGLRRVESAEGAKVVGRNGATDYAGIIFPYVWPGVEGIREYRLRLDRPPLEAKPDGTLKEQQKYLSPPGARSMLYFGPGTPPELLLNVGVPVAITEGEKKTLALCRLAIHETSEPRFLPIGLSGVWNWRGRIGKANGPNGDRRDVKGPIPDLARIAWAARKVFIVFDSNVAENESVSAARNALGRYLAGLGAQVHFVAVPKQDGINGVDDWLAADGPEPVLAAFECATTALSQKTPDKFRVSDRGVFSLAGSGDEVWICSRLDVVAMTRNPDNDDWGLLLRWWDADHREHSWRMPFSLLAGDGSELRARLLAGGLNISGSRNARELLSIYLKSCKPAERARVVDRIGWHNGSFVLPEQTIGPPQDEPLLFESTSGLKHAFYTAGSLEEWTANVGCLCASNSRLQFSVSCAFTGPLLSMFDETGGGFHLRGGSSIGKSTALDVAASVWGRTGKDGYVRSWRSTANGIEAVAELHNDAFLAMDELGQVDPREAGDCAYLLANGLSKNRMGRSGAARRASSWLLLFLSTGEAKLSDHVYTAGSRSRGGQEVRMCEIDADAGAGMGLFEQLHGDTSAFHFSQRIRTAARKYYGTPIRFYLTHLAEQREESLEFLREQQRTFLASVQVLLLSAEVARGASRFALVAAAGELATTLGITGWRPGEAASAADSCFRSWIKERGTTGAWDVEQGIRRVRMLL
jgi:uncharacterized protein (DUF927 family)